MKKTKILILLVLAVSLISAACGQTKCESTCPICGKCNDSVCDTEKCTCGEQNEELCTLSGMMGEGYSFTAEGYTVTSDKLQAPAGAELKLKLVLGESYYTGDPVVKLNGEILKLDGDTYTVTLTSDSILTLEGACFYQVIAQNPFGLKPEGSSTEVGSPMSQSSNVITAQWQANGYSFANIRVTPYYSVMFYIRADNGWISFADRLGQYNEKGTQLYGNGVKNIETGEMEPDSVWHEIKFVRQVDEKDNISYALYVDGKLHTHLDENTPVDARLRDKLNDFVLDLNGTYYVSELFGCADPNYAVDSAEYYIAEQSPFSMELDDLLTEDYPCKESVRYNVYFRPQWGQERLDNFPMEPYSSAKFYISTPASGWIVCRVSGEDVQVFGPGSGWHEFVVESNGTNYNLYIDGKDSGKTIRSNLGELVFTLNDATYYASELFVIDDPYFDGVIDEPYLTEPEKPDLYGTGTLPSNTISVLSNPFTFRGEISEHAPHKGFAVTNKLTTAWNKYSFQYLDLTPYKSVMFSVKTRGWYGMMVGNTVLSEMEGNGGWRMIRLDCVGGNKWRLTYGTKTIDMLTLPNNNLADLNFRFGDDTYYVTDLRAVADPNYKDPFVFIKENPFNIAGEAGEEKADGFEYSTKLVTTWNKYNFNSVNLAPYKEVKFAVKSNGWYGVMDGDTVIDETNGNGGWTVIKLVKTGDDWTLYYGSKEEKTLTLPQDNLTDLAFRFGTDTFYVTELRGIEDPDYVPPQYVNVTNRDPIGKDSVASDDIPDAYFVTGSYAFTPDQWSRGNFGSIDVLAYKELRFFAKPAGIQDKWLEVLKDGAQIFATNDNQWHEIRIEKSESQADVYVDGQKKTSITNLSQLVLQFSENATYTYTDVYGIPDESYDPVTVTITAQEGSTVEFRKHQAVDGILKLQKGDTVYFEVKLDEGYEGTPIVKANGTVLEPVYGLYTLTVNEDTEITVDGISVKTLYETIVNNPFNLTGQAVTDKAEGFAYSTRLSTSWNKYSFVSVDLTDYTEVRFAIKSSGWFGVMEGNTVIDETTSPDWMVIKLVKGESGWTLYYGDKEEKTVVLPTGNLNDLSFRFGTNTYYVSELQGIRSGEEYVSPYVQAAANPINNTPTSTTTENLPSKDVSLVNISNCGWTSPGAAQNVALTKYTELKFYYKVSNGGKWFEMFGSGGNALYQGNSTEWTEIKLMLEDSTWTLYVGGAVQKSGLTGTYLTDIVQSLNLGGSVTADVYVTDLVGIKAPDTKPESSYQVVSENFINATPTSTTDLNLPSTDVNSANIFQCGWTSPGVVDGISVKNYKELKFYYCLSNAGKWFEMYGAGGATLYQGNSTAWREIKFVLEGDTWTLYVNETWTKGGLTGESLKDMIPTLTLGGSVTADVYVTELVGLPKEESSEPEQPESGYAVAADNPVNMAPTSTVTENLPSEDVSKAHVFNCGWTSPGLVDGITMANYTELKFWYKVSDVNKWFEMYGAGGVALYQGNATAWTEIKFVLEGDTWTLYVNETWTKGGLTGTTLKDMVSTLTLGGSVTADVYVTNLIGKVANP